MTMADATALQNHSSSKGERVLNTERRELRNTRKKISTLQADRDKIKNDLVLMRINRNKIEREKTDKVKVLKDTKAELTQKKKEASALLKEKGELSAKIKKLEDDADEVDKYAQKKSVDLEAHITKQRINRKDKERSESKKQKIKESRVRSITSGYQGGGRFGHLGDTCGSDVSTHYLALAVVYPLHLWHVVSNHVLERLFQLFPQGPQKEQGKTQQEEQAPQRSWQEPPPLQTLQ